MSTTTLTLVQVLAMNFISMCAGAVLFFGFIVYVVRFEVGAKPNNPPPARPTPFETFEATTQLEVVKASSQSLFVWAGTQKLQQHFWQQVLADPEAKKSVPVGLYAIRYRMTFHPIEEPKS